MNADSAEILSKPIDIGALVLKNRIVQSPMAVLAPRDDGTLSEQTYAFFEERAKGGVGLIIVSGGVCNDRQLDEAPYFPLSRIDRDEFIPPFQRLAQVVHAHGVPVIAEITGGFGRMGVPRKGPTIAASAVNLVMPESGFPDGFIVPGGRTMPTPQEATIAQIHEIQRSIAAGALRWKKAGFDGVELAAHMSYFEASFLTPRTNKRTDEYGGSIENRARMLAETVRMIHAEVGPDFPVGLRITCNERIEGGQGPEEYAAIAQIVEREGLAYVALSVGCYESMQVGLNSRKMDVIGHGDAQVFRRVLKCPIMVPGLHDPAEAAAAIAAGHCDLTMLARPLLADPHYANKVLGGRAAEIVACDENNYCIRRLMLNLPMRCSVNPQMGRESRKGGFPPLKRITQVPIERAKLSAIASRPLMTLATKLAK